MLLNLNDDYHGYAFLDLYKVNDHFGTEDELKHLIAEAHARDIWIMLDVVCARFYGCMHLYVLSVNVQLILGWK